MELTDARSYNSTAKDEEDTVRPPPVYSEVPDNFPTTLRELKDLGEEDLHGIEEFYGLGHGGNIRARRRRVERCFGVGVTLRQMFVPE